MSTFCGGFESLQGQEISVAIVTLLKGILYREDNLEIWRILWEHHAAISDYVAVMGLVLMVDEAEGYAFLSSVQKEDEGGLSAVPRLIARRQLSYPVSLLLSLLRKKLAEFDRCTDDFGETKTCTCLYSITGTNEAIGARSGAMAY